MIKIVRARKIPIIDIDCNEIIGYEIVVDVDIDGVQSTVGGIDIKTTKEELLESLEKKEAEILANEEGNAKYKPVDRPDLIGEVGSETPM